MPVDYSKWDALELSDDSDIEVHPNVDKKSFIRAKQTQIHQQRIDRKHQIETLKYEKGINDLLLSRVDGLLAALEGHVVAGGGDSRSPDEVLFMAVMKSAADRENDQPPKRPGDVHSKVEEGQQMPPFSKMMATLVDQVKAAVDSKDPDPANLFPAYITEVKEHKAKIDDLQIQLLEKLKELELEESKKITSESYNVGFNASSVSKEKPSPIPSAPKSSTAKGKPKVQAVEVLNPNALQHDQQSADSSGADADIDEPPPEEDDEDDEDIEPTELGKAFAKIKASDLRGCLQFISQNPQVLAERETDGLLVLAFNNQLKLQEDMARNCVHQALLLQYCRALGRDGVGLFFKRITTPGHQAQKVFGDDVRDTYARIKSRAKEIALEREKEDPNDAGGVEQIQLHAVDPGTTINITIPPENSEVEEEKLARELFERFSPGLRRALESGSLDEVNKILGKMSVEEAEEIVAQLGEGGMLSLEEQIMDATTDEGREALKAFEEQERAAAAERRAAEPAGDPE